MRKLKDIAYFVVLLVLLLAGTWGFSGIYAKHLKPPRGTLLNRSHPLARGLVGCWLFNEGTGKKVFDLSGNGNHGDFGSGTAAPSWVIAEHGFALDFDGSDDFISITNFKTFQGPGSLVARIYTRDVTWDPQVIVQMQDTAATYRRFELSLPEAANELWQVYRYNGSVTSDNVAVADQWTHVVATCDNSVGLRLYIDGLLQTGTDTGKDDDYNQFRIGRGADFFYGMIDHVFFYDRMLTAAEVAYLHREPYAMFQMPSAMRSFGYTPSGAPPATIAPRIMHHRRMLQSLLEPFYYADDYYLEKTGTDG